MDIKPLLEFLAVVLGTQPGAIQQALIAEDGNLKPEPEIKSFLSPLIQRKLDDAKRDGKEEGKGWGTKESRKELENWIKETYSIEPTGDIKTQIQSLVTEQTKSKKLSEDDVKNSEVFLTEIKKFQDEIKNRDQEIKNLQETNRREKITAVLSQNAKRVLEENNFLIPEEKEVASNLQKLFIQSLWKEDIDFRVNDDGTIVPTNEKGDPLKDNLHNPIGFDEYSKGVAKMFFPVREGSGKQTPGNQTAPGSGASKTVYNFKSREDAVKAYNAETDAEKKAEIVEAMRNMQ